MQSGLLRDRLVVQWFLFLHLFYQHQLAKAQFVLTPDEKRH